MIRKALIPNPDFQPLKYPVKKDVAMPGNRTIGLPAIVLTSPGLTNHPTHVVLDLSCTRSVGSRAAIERLMNIAWFYGITMEFCRCNKSFVFADRDRNLHIKLHYLLSNSTTMFYQG